MTTAGTGPSTGLVAAGLSVRFGGVVALDNVDLEIPAGAVVGLIGPNGAGKTTFIDAVSGFVAARGSVRLDGRSLDSLRPAERVRAGLVRTFQAGGMFDELTVAENVAIGRGRDRHGGPAHPFDLLDRFGLGDLAGRRPGELSHGRQRLIGLVRAIHQHPAVILLDEPAAGLDSGETEALIAPIRDLADEGVGVLLVDHDVDFVARTCDRVWALDFGRVVASGPTAEVLSSPAVQDSYLGEVPSEVVS